MDISLLRGYSKRRLLHLCAKTIRKEIQYEDYLLKHIRYLDYCVSCKFAIDFNPPDNIYEIIRRLLVRDIAEVRCEIVREFHKLIAPNLDEYVNACCGKVLIKDISFPILMFELIYLYSNKIDGYINRMDWWQFIMSVISYHIVFDARL